MNVKSSKIILLTVQLKKNNRAANFVKVGPREGGWGDYVFKI